MRSQYLKYASIAAILSGFSIASAAADQTPAPPPDVPPPPASGPQAGGGTHHIAGAPAALIARPLLRTGWNLKTCYASKSYVIGSLQYIFAFNTDGSYFYWYTTNGQVATQSELQFACQHRTYWINITNTSPVAYNQVYVPYP